jgi:hypothetical protein
MTASKGKAQERIAKDLVDWLDHHTQVNKDGLTGRALVAENAIRYRITRKRRQHLQRLHPESLGLSSCSGAAFMSR